MKNKIGKILFKKIFAWYVVVAFVLTSFQIYSEYLAHEEALNSSLETTGKIFTRSLTNAVWNLDEDQVKSTIGAIVAIDNIIGVSIRENEKSLIAEVGETSMGDKAVSYSFNLERDGEVIANVALYSTTALIISAMKDNVILIVFNSLIKSLVLMLLVYYFSNKIITQTLHQLIEALNKINFSDKDHLDVEQIDIANDNEVSILVNSYNKMKDKIHDEIDKNRELSERVELALLGSNDGVWDWNIIDNSVYFSPRWKEMLGYSDEELPNEIATWAERVHPDDIDEVWADIYRNVEGETDFYENIHRLKHKSGHWVWILDRGKTQYDKSGKAIRMIGTHRDISNDKELEESLNLQAQIIEQTHDSVVTTDFEGIILSWNLGAELLFGYTASEVIGKSVSILYPPGAIANLNELIDILKDKGEYRADLDNVTKSGKIIAASFIRNGIENEEFIVYYQPQVDAQNEKLIGMEALVRWEHPTMGLVAPSRFIPLAESTGLIVELDRFVMKSAIKQLVEWYKSGLEPGVLALNLAMKQLQQKDFMLVLHETLQESGCSANYIEFEVTESQVMKNPQEAISLLKTISKLGIGLAIDDFGTGYSSLSYLKKLPINKLKIDQSFVRDLPDDEEDVGIAKAVIALAKSLNLRIIAEGVETPEQKEFLLANGCSNIQGYLYAKPMPADEMEILLTKGIKS